MRSRLAYLLFASSLLFFGCGNNNGSAGSDLGVVAGGDVDMAGCGQLGEVCCGKSCGAGACVGGVCQPCGGPGQSCCPGRACDAADVCTGGGAGVCTACGDAGEACCGANTCNGGGCCVADVCAGAGSTCPMFGGACASGACGSCGGA